MYYHIMPVTMFTRPINGTLRPFIMRHVFLKPVPWQSLIKAHSYSSNTANVTGASITSSPLYGSYHWLFERVVAISNLSLLTSMIMAPPSWYSLILE